MMKCLINFQVKNQFIWFNTKICLDVLIRRFALLESTFVHISVVSYYIGVGEKNKHNSLKAVANVKKITF